MLVLYGGSNVKKYTMASWCRYVSLCSVGYTVRSKMDISRSILRTDNGIHPYCPIFCDRCPMGDHLLTLPSTQLPFGMTSLYENPGQKTCILSAQASKSMKLAICRRLPILHNVVGHCHKMSPRQSNDADSVMLAMWMPICSPPTGLIS